MKIEKPVTPDELDEAAMVAAAESLGGTVTGIRHVDFPKEYRASITFSDENSDVSWHFISYKEGAMTSLAYLLDKFCKENGEGDTKLMSFWTGVKP